MAAEITIYIDIINRRLVKGLDNSDLFPFTEAYGCSQLNLAVIPVMPTYAPTGGKFTKVDISGLTLKCYVGPRAGASAVKASQTTWTKVYDPGVTTGKFTAELDLNTSEMNTAIGSNDSYSSFVEFWLTENGMARQVYQGPFTVYAAVFDSTGSALPTSASNYLTREECIEMFVRFFGNAAGKTIETVSPDGASSRITGCNNDKSAKDDLI